MNELTNGHDKRRRLTKRLQSELLSRENEREMKCSFSNEKKKIFENLTLCDYWADHVHRA